MTNNQKVLPAKLSPTQFAKMILFAERRYSLHGDFEVRFTEISPLSVMKIPIQSMCVDYPGDAVPVKGYEEVELRTATSIYFPLVKMGYSLQSHVLVVQFLG